VPGLIVSAHFSLNMDLSVDGVIRWVKIWEKQGWTLTLCC
jgi:hypothetical protein